ncbi:MAG TPA: ATP-binding protein [Kofleriaceae bacterium]
MTEYYKQDRERLSAERAERTESAERRRETIKEAADDARDRVDDEADAECERIAADAEREREELARELETTVDPGDRARIKSERERIKGEAHAEKHRIKAEAHAERERIRAEAEAERARVTAEVETERAQWSSMSAAQRETERAKRWAESMPAEEQRWIAHQQAKWDRDQRRWSRRAEAWKHRQAKHAEWHARHKRFKALHEEREMWMREGQRTWWPWWLQSRMRRRILFFLAVAFAGGVKFGVTYWHDLRWWHGLVIFGVLSALSGVIAFRLTRPLIIAIRAAQDIGDGKLDTRIDVKRHRGETRLLATAINEMAERIETQLKDQRELLAAVSHELRTPLGHMRVLIETARDSQPGATGSEKALGELDREVIVLDDLVGKLLASSRLEFGNLDARSLDLGALVTDVATAAGVPPEAIEATGDVTAVVDPTLVRRAVANLLDNARVHGNGAIAVRIERRAAQVAIEVDDAGPGVPADRRADAFRAFVPSRAGGLGLGLALVSRIAVAHAGGAWISDAPGGGARVGFTVAAAGPLPT